ncbi:glycosyltransferase [Chitinophagaceae bacterium LB-8]|uniref:Glycosyltransferase n=1 Tax=Paraflavisolibacter caeni TaxID=2982496 RepID=A0A9X2XP36_9BACT|nr:glycosyltransferase [Paraflavisolibacter caeni]MCU7550348.1 glycosyltransferase [Paraflavisolibacter caeni]
MKLAGVVILYNPDEALIERVDTYRHYLDKLIVVDNSEISNQEIIRPLWENKDVHFIHNGKNEGISKRLNEAATIAIKNGFDWLLTMDQDSYFEKGVFDAYLNCISQYENIDNVAMFGIEYDERNVSQSPCDFQQVNHLITSGSLVNLKIFNELKGFDVALFIDNVDHEYCFHAKAVGYEIVKVQDIFLQHSLGVVSQHRSLKNLSLTPRTLHSPIRMYYTVRNYFYLSEKYSKLFPEDIKEIKKSILNRIKNNLLYNEKRMQVLKNIIKGYADYKNGRMGKIS